jgi:phosphoribosylaminoimidazole-succinocarboxamide synthase
VLIFSRNHVNNGGSTMGSELIYEGKSKRVYVKTPDELVMEFKDEVTAGDGAYRAVAPGKGVLCATTSAYLFRYLEGRGIRTHFLDYDGVRRLTVRRLRMIPLEVIVRNYAYGSLLKRMPLFRELQPLNPPLVEFHYKDDSLHDPLVLSEDVVRVGLASRELLDAMVEASLRVNEELSKLLASKGLTLVDAKFEFGLLGGELLLADEISGDTVRVIDESGRHLDKEVFRRSRSVEALLAAYRELTRRLGLEVAYG